MTMGIFRSEVPVDEQLTALTTQIERLSKQVAELKGENAALTERRALIQEKLELQAEIEQLKIEQDRLNETHAREKREVEHATGLYRKQSEWERQRAVEEAKLAVEKGNLDAERQRFAEQIEFHKAQIKNEVDRLEKLLGGLMERLPTVTVEKAISISNGNGNGH